MEAAWQDVQQEAADELLGREHDLLPSAPSRRYLVTEGKAALIERMRRLFEMAYRKAAMTTALSATPRPGSALLAVRCTHK
jgi:hypothetical protein